MRTLSLAALLLTSTTAVAVPMQLTHQARLFDSLGVPLTGSHDVDVALYDVPVGGTAAWSDTLTVDFDDGFVTLQLGSGAALDAAIFDGDSLWLGLAIDSGPEMTARPELVSVPYAIYARSAESVAGGGTVDATEIMVDGTTVIDSDGNIDWSHITGAPDPGTGLPTCADGLRLQSNGTDWNCVDPAHVHDASEIATGTLDINRLPVGQSSTDVAAGDHGHDAGDITGVLDVTRLPSHTHAASDITGTLSVSSLPVGTGSTDVAAGDHSHAFSDLTGVPAGLDDGDDDTTYSAGNGVLIDSSNVISADWGTGNNNVARGNHDHSGNYLEIPSGYTKTNNIWHTDVRGPVVHYEADRDCANDGAHLCRLAQWHQIGDATSVLAKDAQVWIDGLDPMSKSCQDVSWTTGLRMRGWETGNAYTQRGPVACANRNITTHQYRCCVN